MSVPTPSRVSVLDFRRRRMAMQWNITSGEWSSHEEAPERVYGIALIRPGASNIALYGHAGALILQIGPQKFELTGAEPPIQISCGRVALSLGFRREIVITSSHELFRHQYWVGSRPDFFKLLAYKAASAEWRAACARSWSAGVSSPHLRESWAR